jgi:hypothetical protein
MRSLNGVNDKKGFRLAQARLSGAFTPVMRVEAAQAKRRVPAVSEMASGYNGIPLGVSGSVQACRKKTK